MYPHDPPSRPYFGISHPPALVFPGEVPVTPWPDMKVAYLYMYTVCPLGRDEFSEYGDSDSLYVAVG